MFTLFSSTLMGILSSTSDVVTCNDLRRKYSINTVGVLSVCVCAHASKHS